MDNLKCRLLRGGKIVGYERHILLEHERTREKFINIQYSSDDCGWSNIPEIIHDAKEQYTTYSDKNGVEICEGDNIQFKNVHNERRTGEVLFAKGSWCVNYKDPDGCFGYSSMYLDTIEKCGFIEIIGNIHETKEE